MPHELPVPGWEALPGTGGVAVAEQGDNPGSKSLPRAVGCHRGIAAPARLACSGRLEGKPVLSNQG